MIRRAVAIALLVFFSSFTLALAEGDLMLTNGEWPPYFSQKFKHYGVGSLICQEAFALEGINVKYDFMPWKRGLEYADTAGFDGTVGWRKSAKKEKRFYFSDPILYIRSVFFHQEGSHFDWNNFDEIGAMTVGGTLGYHHVDVLEPYIRKNGGKLDVAPTDVINLQKLAAGRIDIFPCDEVVGYYLLSTQFLPGTANRIKHHPKSLFENTLHLLISKKRKDGKVLIEKFNRGLTKLKESGRYNTYLTESLRGAYQPTTP